MTTGKVELVVTVESVEPLVSLATVTSHRSIASIYIYLQVTWQHCTSIHYTLHFTPNTNPDPNPNHNPNPNLTLILTPTLTMTMTMTLWQYINDTSTCVLLCVNRTTDTHLDNGAGHMVRRTLFPLLGRIWDGKCRYENCIIRQQAVRYSPLTHLHMQVYRSNVLVICAGCYHAVRGISDKVVHTCICHLHNTSKHDSLLNKTACCILSTYKNSLSHNCFKYKR